MGRGILSGLFWGSIISIVVLSVVSLLTPSPQRVAQQPEGAAQAPADVTPEPEAGGVDTDGEDAAATGTEISATETDQTDQTDEAATETGPDDAEIATGDIDTTEIAETDTDVADIGATDTEISEPDAPGLAVTETDTADIAGDTASAETADTDLADTDLADTDLDVVLPGTDQPVSSAAPGDETAEAPAPDAPGRPRTEVASTISVPAGSEFRRPPPETEAELPSPDASLPEKATPDVPTGQAGDSTFAMPDTNAAARPETPGMSVTAPVAPEAGEPAPRIASELPADTGSGSRTAALPPEPGAPAEREDLASNDALGLPPPVTPSAVASAPLPRTEATSETPSTESPAETLVSSGQVPAGEVETTESASLEATTAEILTHEGGADTPAASEAAPAPEVETEQIASLGAGEADMPTPVTAPANMPAPVTTPADTPAPVEADPVAVAPSEAEAPEAVLQPPVSAEPAEGLGAVTAEQGSAVEGTTAEPAAPSGGERLAMAEGAAAMPETVGADRITGTGEAEPADPAGRAETVTAAAAAPAPSASTDLDRPERIEIDLAEPGETPPAVGDEAPTGPGVRVLPLTERGGIGSRLPQIGTDDPQAEGEEVAVATDTPDGALPGDAEVPGGALRLGALSRNSVPFANPQGKPLFSVILIDDGSRTLDRQVLSTFSFPVTFAIDPTMPDAAEAAEYYRSNGFEVVVLATGLPENAQARDLEVTLEAELATVPQAVAIMDPDSDGFGNRRTLVEHVVSIAAHDGHGLIGWDRGLGSVEAAAAREDHPAALVFRSLDDQGERGPVIQRYLDRAAFKAQQEGTVIMAGHARPETVTALFEWSATEKASEMALAPVSAILRAP